MGTVAKIFLEFPENVSHHFPRLTSSGFNFLRRKEQSRDCSSWRNSSKERWQEAVCGLYPHRSNPNLLVAWITGQAAAQVEPISLDWHRLRLLSRWSSWQKRDWYQEWKNSFPTFLKVHSHNRSELEWQDGEGILGRGAVTVISPTGLWNLPPKYIFWFSLPAPSPAPLPAWLSLLVVYCLLERPPTPHTLVRLGNLKFRPC